MLYYNHKRKGDKKIDSFIKAFLLEKYGEKVYNLNSHLFEQSLKTLEDELANFTCDYYGAFKDCDFLFDVIIWKRMEEKNNGFLFGGSLG